MALLASKPLRPFPYRQTVLFIAGCLALYLVLGGLLAAASRNARIFRDQLMVADNAIDSIRYAAGQMHDLALLDAATGEQVFAARYDERLATAKTALHTLQDISAVAEIHLLVPILRARLEDAAAIQRKALDFAVRYAQTEAWAILRGRAYEDALGALNACLDHCDGSVAARADAVLAQQNRYTWAALWCVGIFTPFFAVCGLTMARKARRDAKANIDAQAAVRESAQTMAALLDATTDRVFLADVTGRLLSINAAGARALERTPEQAVGQTLDALFEPDVAAARLARLHQALASGSIIRFTDEREGVIFDHVVAPLPEVADKPARAALFARDTTDLVRAREAAEAASRAKSEFLANLGHEIRTPLNGILGMTQVLAGLDTTDDQRACLDDLTAASGALLRLIDNLLELATMEAGRAEVVRQPFVLHSVIEAVSGATAAAARDKGLSYQMEIAPTVPQLVVGDGDKLRQALLHLTENAVKFTNTGGVRLTILCQEACPDAENPAPAVVLRFAVADTGIGVASRDTRRIFECFTQADGSATRRFGGTGLGLTIADHLIHLLGGEIQLESEPGQGSIFSFCLDLPLPRPDMPAEG